VLEARIGSPPLEFVRPKSRVRRETDEV
jgi:hypothetical protein